MGVAETLEHVNVPSYVIDATGIIRWVNPAAQRIVGDVRGRQFTSVVSPEDTRRARELFAQRSSARRRSQTPTSRWSAQTAAGLASK